METYTIPTVSQEIIEKAIARYQKKAAAYGCELVATFGEPYAKERKVYEIVFDETGSHRHQVCTQLIEVFDLSIESDLIRKDGYSVIAKIEHLEGGNVVSTYESEGRAEWSELKPRCQHCGGKHGQKITFIVRHANGTELQVGRTCLKDYCGIDPKHIAALKELHDLILGENEEHHDYSKSPAIHAYTVAEVLAIAIKVNKEQGYIKSSEIGSNSEIMGKLVMKNYKPTEAEIKAGEELAEAISKIDRDDARAALLDNVQSIIRSKYCKGTHFGYMAYAPLAYKRYCEKLAEQQQREAKKEQERSSSEHIGQIGQRMVIEVAEMSLLTSWETQYGYTYLYRFTDKAGNVLVWFASKQLDNDTRENTTRIKATVKDHTERDGIKQTVITRCTAA